MHTYMQSAGQSGGVGRGSHICRCGRGALVPSLLLATQVVTGLLTDILMNLPMGTAKTDVSLKNQGNLIDVQEQHITNRKCRDFGKYR
ncbi:hypothetical protein J6590_039575 [Homalodisca vitripennis]|nr:hypothetical protein J6590_039575 [Homalodisca vitripennis]